MFRKLLYVMQNFTMT